MAPEIYFPNLNLKIPQLSREAFSLFGIPVYWYGLIIMSAIIIGYVLLSRKLEKQNESIDDYLNFIMLELIVSIVGARLYFVIFSWEYYSKNLLQIFNLRSGGIAIYGAILVAILSALIYTKVTKRSFLKIADLFAPLLVLGQSMGRWGNFFNREAFGGFSDGIFSMALRIDTVRYIPTEVANNMVEYFGNKYIQVQPTFLYESVCCLSIFILLIVLEKYKKFEGQLFYTYVIVYSFCRFFIEGYRTDQLLIFNMPISQIVALMLMIVGGIAYVITLKELIRRKR